MAGAVTCWLPLVPGYLAYVTGMSGTGAHSGQATAGSTAYLSASPAAAVAAGSGLAAGGISELLRSHSAEIAQVLGGVTVALGLLFSTGTAARSAFLALVYGLGLGIPFLVVAVLFERTLSVTEFFKRHARLVTRIGGLLLIALSLFEATGTWTAVVTWMHPLVPGLHTPALKRT